MMATEMAPETATIEILPLVLEMATDTVRVTTTMALFRFVKSLKF